MKNTSQQSRGDQPSFGGQVIVPTREKIQPQRKGKPYSVPDWASYQEKGAGIPVILIHGLAASLYDWENLMPELTTAGYHSYALDILGHGDSPKPEARSYKLKWILRHFEQWIDTLKLSEPLILIGHSLGSYLSLRYTLRHPERVRAMVLASPFYRLDQLPFILRRTYRRPTLNSIVMERLPRWVFQIAIDFTSQAMGRIGEGTNYLPEGIRFQTALDYKRTHPGAFNIPNTVHDLTADLHRINQPTLVAWGTHDQTLCPALFQPVVDRIPTAEVFTLKAGHVPHQSHPEEFNKAVMEFLTGL